MRDNEHKHIKIYTLVSTGVDADRGFFPDPDAKGSYLSLSRARAELARLVDAEKKELTASYNCEESSEDHWEAFESGYAAARFSRIEILTSELCLTIRNEEEKMKACYICGNDLLSGLVVCPDCAGKSVQGAISIEDFIYKLAEDIVLDDNIHPCHLCVRGECPGQVSGLTCLHGVAAWMLNKLKQYQQQDGSAA